MYLKFNKTKMTLALLGLLAVSPAFAKAPLQDGYVTSGTCAGLPKIVVDTPKGFCVGLVAKGFKFTRGIATLPNGDLLVVDMNGWVENKGSIWLLSPSKSTSSEGIIYKKTRLLKGIDRPNGIIIGPDNKIYVGAIDRIFRFELINPEKTMQDVVGGNSGVAALPSSGLHPLTSMVFDQDNNLFVNVGSESNACSNAKGGLLDANKMCPETKGDNPRGTLRKYTMKWPAGTVSSEEVYAEGLRNSMALAIHPKTGELWQGENSRDNISALDSKLKDAEFPHDEINLIKKGGVYGWPYCFDSNRAVPEYQKWDCSNYTAPQLLLPAHAAPLGMTFYTGKQFPAKYKNSLIVGFHGYRNTGHRLMAYQTNQDGKPSGQPEELIAGWGKKGAPTGAPVDVKMGNDGTLYMTEDRNGTVLRLNYVGE